MKIMSLSVGQYFSFDFVSATKNPVVYSLLQIFFDEVWIKYWRKGY